MAVTLAVIAAAALAVLANGAPSPSELLGLTSSDTSTPQVMLKNQRERVYLPASYRIRSNAQNKFNAVPRLPQGGEKVMPSTIADVFAHATAQSIGDVQKEAFRTRTVGLINVSASTVRPPLVFGVNATRMGGLQDYPFSWFEANKEGTPIENQRDIWKSEKNPSTFAGPTNNIFPLATAPDTLRNPWQADGVYARAIRQIRNPTLDTRPVFAPKDPPSRQVISTTRPWQRRVAGAYNQLPPSAEFNTAT